jgi:hypothetical protein
MDDGAFHDGQKIQSLEILYIWVCAPSNMNIRLFIMPEEKKRKLSNIKVVTMIASILEPDDFAEYPYMVGFKC